MKHYESFSVAGLEGELIRIAKDSADCKDAFVLGRLNIRKRAIEKMIEQRKEKAVEKLRSKNE